MGPRDSDMGIWFIHVMKPTTPVPPRAHYKIIFANNILTEVTKSKLAQYYHVAYYSPIISMWQKGIKNRHTTAGTQRGSPAINSYGYDEAGIPMCTVYQQEGGR